MEKETQQTDRSVAFVRRDLDSVVSHDLMSALAGVLSGLDLINTDRLDADNAAQIGRIRGSAKMLQEMIQIALNLNADKERDHVDLFNELDLIKSIWDVQAKAKGFEFRLEGEPTAVKLQSRDTVSLHRVLNNLINNSFKYGGNSDIVVKITQPDPGLVKIDVMDNGRGFGAEILDQVFEYGARRKDEEKSGSGLGLFIVKTLVESMDGTITAGNRDSGGAIISMEFPCLSENTSRRAAPVLPDLSGIHILLAEDNVTNQLVVTQMLKKMGATYKIASDGVEAIDRFHDEIYDVVLLDIEMPRKSGLEVLHEIRTNGGDRAKLPVLALTAYVMQEHREKIFAAGADGLIAKPIEGIASLGNAILGFVTGKQAATRPGDEVRLDCEDVGQIDSQIFADLKAMMGPDSIHELLEKVATDLKTIQDDLIRAEAENDMQAIRASSHTLVSVAGAIGATNLQYCAQALNSTAKTDDISKRQGLNLQCIDGIHSVLDYISSA